MQNFIYTILVTAVQREEVVSLVFEVCNYKELLKDFLPFSQFKFKRRGF